MVGNKTSDVITSALAYQVLYVLNSMPVLSVYLFAAAAECLNGSQQACLVITSGLDQTLTLLPHDSELHFEMLTAVQVPWQHEFPPLPLPPRNLMQSRDGNAWLCML